MINFDEFQKVELKIARIIEADRIVGSDKLLRLKVSLGEEERQILAGIGKAYEPENIVGRLIVVVANLAPRQMMGEESNGMVVAATDENGYPVLISPEKEVKEGTLLK